MICLRNSVQKHYQAGRGYTPGFNKNCLSPTMGGNVKLSHASQVKVNAREGQTCVFISIILHNNMACVFLRGTKKRKQM